MALGISVWLLKGFTLSSIDRSTPPISGSSSGKERLRTEGILPVGGREVDNGVVRLYMRTIANGRASSNRKYARMQNTSTCTFQWQNGSEGEEGKRGRRIAVRYIPTTNRPHDLP